MITIYPGNGHVIAKEIKEADANTGKPVAARGLTGVMGHLSTSPTDPPLANTTVALTEYDRQPGLYRGAIDGSVLSIALDNFEDNRRLYEVVTYQSELKAASPVRVRKERIQ